MLCAWVLACPVLERGTKTHGVSQAALQQTRHSQGEACVQIWRDFLGNSRREAREHCQRPTAESNTLLAVPQLGMAEAN